MSTTVPTTSTNTVPPSSGTTSVLGDEQQQQKPLVSSPLLVRKVQKAESVAECMALIPDENPTEDLILATLHVCWKNSDLNTATQLLNRHPTEPCRTLAISIAGKCGDYQAALKFLDLSTSSSSSKPTDNTAATTSSPSVASYHAALAACGKANAWKECLDLYQKHLNATRRTTFTANIVLTAMSKSNRGLEALEFFAKIKQPDKQSVLKTMTALIGMGDLDRAYTFVKDHGTSENNDLLIDRLTSAYAKKCNWEMVRKLNADNSNGGTFQPWTVLPKIGKGRTAYWKLGTFVSKEGDVNLTVGLQPHRNPSKNGIKLILIDNTNNNSKIGYLLMKNNASESSLLGVFLDPNQRQRGLSKIFLAIWMKLCLDADIDANTGVMNKPLLCLTLQHTFGYTPPALGGVPVEIAASTTEAGKIVMYSATAKAIAGAFSPSDQKREGLVFVSKPPEPRGRVVRMKACLFAPEGLASKVESILDGGGTFDYDRTHCIKTIMCGE